jgi:hypothetical protein
LSVLKSVQSFNGGIKFGSDVQITGQAVADTAQNAASLAAVVKLGVNLLSMNSGKDAQAAQLAQLLQTIQVSTSGTDLNLAMTVPESQAEALLNQLWKPSADVRPASLPRANLPPANTPPANHRWRQAPNGN